MNIEQTQQRELLRLYLDSVIFNSKIVKIKLNGKIVKKNKMVIN